MSAKKTGIKHDQKVILKTRDFSGSCYVTVQRKYSLQKGVLKKKIGPHILSNKDCIPTFIKIKQAIKHTKLKIL